MTAGDRTSVIYDINTEKEEKLYATDGSKSIDRVFFTPDGKGLLMVLLWQDL